MVLNFKEIYRKNPLFLQILVYGVIGVFCATLDSVVFLLLRSFDANIYIANFISINTGIACSFFLNTFLNFRVKENFPKRALKFFAIGYCGIVLSMLLMYLGVKILRYSEIAVKLISVIIVALFQFTLNKVFTFRISREAKDE